MLLQDLNIVPGRQTRSAAGPAGPALSNVSRRGFVVGAGTLVLGVSLMSACAPGENAASPLAGVRGGDATPSLFISIAPDGKTQITCHRSEMGQQVWTAMAQIIADELEADWDSVEIVQAIGHPIYGDQNTDGSRSVRRNLHRLRIAGAALRAMLEKAAANIWDVEAADCQGVLGQVTHVPSGRTLSYGELAEAASALPVPEEADIALKDRKDWRYIATGAPSLTGPKIIRGEGTYGIDVQMPNMVHAVIARPPQISGRVQSYDDTAALAVPGVLRTVQLPDATSPLAFNPLGGVAVIAKDTWAAMKGREALTIRWDAGPNAEHDSKSFAAEMMATARTPGDVRRNVGDAPAALETAATRIRAEYYAPHLSQAPMEPPAATARWTDGKVECWACTQTPQASRSTVASVCGIPEDDVTINVTLLGGGFGRKSKPDFVAEAALLAREMGQPVKVTWTREDDLQHGYLHSVSAQYLEAGLDENGACQALVHRSVFPPIVSTFQAGEDNPSAGELELGASDMPFALPHIRLETGRAKAHLRIGWLRSVANVYHSFAIQSFAAEMAHAAGRDQKDYLLELIGAPRLIDPNQEGAEYTNYGDPLSEYPIDTGRLANVTRIAADMASWGRTLAPGHGLGIATHRSFLSYVATVVEVAVDADGAITIPGVWSAVDAGTVVNTRNTIAQIEGGTIYGLSNALYGEISAKNGIVEQANFPDWRVMRISEAPRTFKTHIVPSNAPPGGVGEPGTPPAAPALTNAIFAATGMRIRNLPVLGAYEDRLELSSAREA